MVQAERIDLETRIQREADLLVEPYKDKAPPVVLRKLRELAERYLREHPQASRILQLQDYEQQLISGEKVNGLPVDEVAADVRVRKV